MKKTLKSIVLPLVGLAVLAWFFPRFVAFYLLCGIYDVGRNRKLTVSKVTQYFFGNGALTWILSPFNILMALLCLPYGNKGVYKLEDLPPAYRAEIQELIDTAYAENVVGQIEERAKDLARTMIFFKWYGANVDTFLNIPAYHKKFKYIQTVGVSVFNKKQSTSRHFGPYRASLRVLYNINDMVDHSAYIEVGDTLHYWQDEKLFIFDDTLMHQSFNESDNVRYCLFVDIVRPSPVAFLLVGVIRAVRVLLRGVNFVFYKNWKVIEK